MGQVKSVQVKYLQVKSRRSSWDMLIQERPNKDRPKHQYYFANISAMNNQIFMKFYVVVNYYLVSLSFKFNEDLCTNARVQGVNVHTRDRMGVLAFSTFAPAFIYKSS